MPISTVIKFNIVKGGELKDNISKKFHGLLFQWFKSIDENMASEIHESTIKPFSISQIKKNKVDNKLWIKISFFTDELILKMMSFFNDCTNKSYILGSTTILIDEILYYSSDNPWACANEYIDIINKPLDRKIKLQFLTPTAFKQGDYLVPLPLANLIFKSILAKWNVFSPYTIPEIYLQNIEEFLIISSYNIRTDSIKFSNFSTIGFIGEVSFTILEKAPENLIKSINILSNFAIYSGVGYKNTMGMGICRKL